MKQERGLFIVFEGLDRCGKSTQVEKLIQHFQDIKKQKVCRV
jgi:thymidylate kinase